MGLTKLRRKLGALSGQLHILDAQRRQSGIARHLRDIGKLARVETCLAERDQPALALDTPSLGRRVAAVEI